MINITVVENGFIYACSVEEDDVYMYINENKNIMDCLNDEQKILKAIYEIWLEDNRFLMCWGYDIPENSPHYGEKWYYIENISFNDIKWNDDKVASKVINKNRLKLECTKAMTKELDIYSDSCYVGIDIVGNFYIEIKDALLYFYKKDLNFKNGYFSGKYRLKKNRGIINIVHKAVIKNEKLIKSFMQC